MNTYAVKNSEGAVIGFEIDNPYFAPVLRRLLQRIPGISGVHLRRAERNGAEDVMATFTFDEKEYLVLEPFRDNSRLWIRPAADGSNSESSDVKLLEQRFAQQRFPLLFSIRDILRIFRSKR